MKQLNIVAALGCALMLTGSLSCKKIEKGFLSPNVRYVNGVISVPRGMTYVASEGIGADGSTPPFSYKLLNLRNKDNGQPAPKEFFTKYDVDVFKTGMVFNAATDTTIALLNKKREKLNTTPMIFNEKSGQLVFNRASANLPLGNYIFDVEMTNPNGTRLFPNLGEIKVVDPSLQDYFQVTYQATNGSSSTEQFTATTAPLITCERISGSGARIYLKITDKNNVPFNPKAGEVIRRGDRPRFETHAKFNPVQLTDSEMICDFEVAPFPLTGYKDAVTDWGFLMYYRIPMAYANIDNLPNNNVNPAFAFRILLEGTYVVTIKLPSVTHK